MYLCDQTFFHEYTIILLRSDVIHLTFLLNFFRPHLYCHFLMWNQLSASVWLAIFANASSTLKKKTPKDNKDNDVVGIWSCWQRQCSIKKEVLKRANQNEKQSQVLSAGMALDFVLKEKSLLLLPNFCPFWSLCLCSWTFVYEGVCAISDSKCFFTFLCCFHY